MPDSISDYERSFDKQAREGKACDALDTLKVIQASLPASEWTKEWEKISVAAAEGNSVDRNLPQIHLQSVQKFDDTGAKTPDEYWVQLQYQSDARHSYPKIVFNEDVNLKKAAVSATCFQENTRFNDEPESKF